VIAFDSGTMSLGGWATGCVRVTVSLVFFLKRVTIRHPASSSAAHQA
jgi:hypothetical protein